MRFGTDLRSVCSDRWRVALAAVVIGFLGTTGVAHACDTPVYRYAMYRWRPAPYEAYLFYDGTMDENGEGVKQAIEQLSEKEGARANIMFLPVNVQEDKELTGVPPDVKEAWQSREEQKLPAYLISTPVGAHIHIGAFSKTEIGDLVDSPMRQQIGKLLESGKAGVFVLVTGKDADADKQAQETIRAVVSEVNSGELNLYQAPTPMFGGPDAEAGEEAVDAPPSLQMGLIELTRDDPKESWLMRCLMALEPDLADRTDPMIFTLYGRGRAVFSCLGKGIHRDNLVMDVEFITGACSCTVKEQNPGVDLLMTYDWDAASAAIAEKFGSEEGSEYQFGGDELFPELIIPSGDMVSNEQETADQTVPAALTMPADDQTESEATQTTAVESVAVNSPTVEPSSEKLVAAAQSEAPELDEVAESTVQSAAETIDNPGSASLNSGVLLVAAGLGVAFIVLLGVTFFVLRP